MRLVGAPDVEPAVDDAPVLADADVLAIEDAPAVDDAAFAAALLARASVASTCFSVILRGGLVVMMVAESLSPVWKSDS